MIKVALHQISTSHINLFFASILEIIHATMFEITSHNALNSNVFTYPFNARFQGAHAANQQINLNTCLRSFIEQHNKTRVYNSIHLKNKVGFLSGPRMFDFASDKLFQSGTQIDRSNEQFPKIVFG